MIVRGDVVTKYEKACYDIVTKSHNHLTVNQVYEKLKELFPDVVQATVYNNLNKLCESGLIRKVCIEDICDRFDSAHKHDHLVCKECGKLTDIQFDDLTQMIKKHIGDDFCYYDLKVFNICPECKAKKENC